MVVLYAWHYCHPAHSADGEAGLLIPSRAVKASDRMFVVRGSGGDVGKFIADEGAAKLPLNGRERTVDDFEFLVPNDGTDLSWVAATADGPPEGCVWASPRMAVIRATDHPDCDPGKYIADERKAAVPRNGRELELKPGSYEFLVVRSRAREGLLLGQAASASDSSGASAAHQALGERGQRLGALASSSEHMAGEAKAFAELARDLNRR